VREHLEHSPLKDAKLDDKFYVMHERMKAKLLGYLQPETALLRYTDSDVRIPARYARAIALYRTAQIDRALAVTDSLIKQEPDNPFFYELKGQILFDSGHVQDSVAVYKKSVDLLPSSALLRQSYGQSLVESQIPANLDPAIAQLLEANHLEDHMPFTWHLLAAAWGRKAEISGNVEMEAMATYALAEEAAAKGNDKPAAQLAERAMKGLPKGSTYWLRAQDIKLSVAAADPDKKDK
jgi:predicted Zn-dependent protease